MERISFEWNSNHLVVRLQGALGYSDGLSAMRSVCENAKLALLDHAIVDGTSADFSLVNGALFLDLMLAACPIRLANGRARVIAKAIAMPKPNARVVVVLFDTSGAQGPSIAAFPQLDDARTWLQGNNPNAGAQ